MTSRKGFVYDTTSRADPGNVSPEASDYEGVVDVGVLVNGSFNDSISSLVSEEVYYYRAFGYDDVAGKYLYGEEVTFQTLPPYIIKGNVKNGTHNVEGAVVRLIRQGTNTYIGSTTTDVDGNYEFMGLVKDQYYHVFCSYDDGVDKYHTYSYFNILPVEAV